MVDWNALFGYAQSQLGQPYVYGGTGGGGFDCSGFTQAVYASVGLHIGRNTTAQFQSGQVVGQDGNWGLDISQLEPGDLIFYGQQGASGPNAHVVMYIGNGQVIQAGGSNVNITNLFQAASANEPFMGIRRYTSFTNAPPSNSTGGVVDGIGPAGNTSAPSLTMADVPEVIKWIKENWGSYAWLLDPNVAPGVALILEQAAVAGLSPDQVQAKIEQSNWWRTTSAAMRQYEQDKAQNPADYNFSTPGSKAAQMYAQIANASAGYGVTLTPTQLQELALQALEFGWNAQQIQQAVGKNANAGNAQQITQQINTMANQYFQTLTPQTETLWTQQLAEGTRTIQEFQAQMAAQAAGKWTGFAQQLGAGYTMNQLTDNLRQEAAKTMEVDPNSINFTTDPTYQKVVDFAPPTPAGASQLPQHRVMTLSEMDQYLKGLPAWGSTQNARNATADIEQTLLQNFGKVTG